ncbi:MAG: 3-dehydroquinate synthase [Calditrichia bacterium]
MPNLSLQIESARREVPVILGNSLWPRLLDFVREHFPEHSIYVIADSNLVSHYDEEIISHFSTLDHFREILSFPAGENSKSRRWKTCLEDAMIRHRAGRDSLLLAIGGGVTGDLAGYVAASLFRGIPYIQVPTSLLAMVDSSIGGKVGLNHPRGKNLIGAFYHPRAIFMDLDFLSTLPQEEFRSGLAEVCKYAVILPGDLWELLEKNIEQILKKEPDVLQRVVSRCAELKMKVVATDEMEEGYRTLLNFGHTVGHAIEKISHYNIKHGFAVAAGMDTALHLSEKMLGFPAPRREAFSALLERFGLNQVSAAEYEFDRIWQIIQLDKKARRRKARFTLLEAPGKPRLLVPVGKAELRRAIGPA